MSKELPNPLTRSNTIRSSTRDMFSVARVYQMVNRVASMRPSSAGPDTRTEEEKRKDALRIAKGKVHEFTCSSAREVCKKMGVVPSEGLTTADAEKRYAEHGPNELEKEPPRPFWRLLLDQFSDLLVIMLIVASLISLGLGEYVEAIVILLIVISNAVLGVVQETRAEAALDALQSMFAPEAVVMRDGRINKIASSKLVPGDVVILDLGCTIPADCRLIDSQDLYVDEVIFTGETAGVKKDAAYIAENDEQPKSGQSSPSKDSSSTSPRRDSEKKVNNTDDVKQPDGGGKEMKEMKEKPKSKEDEKNLVFMGSAVQDGRGKGVVVRTGMHTRMGEIATLLAGAEKGESPLQVKLHNLGVRLGIGSITLSIIVFIIGITTERGTDPDSSQPVWLQMLLVAVSLTVASVPEGLPACVTITLAIGMREMVRKNAVIRNLHSVETLGSASVICTDKTGTLTAGAMTAVRMWFNGTTYRITGAGYDPKGLVCPMDVPVDDEKQQEVAAQALKGKIELPLLLGALCSNSVLQYDEEKKKWEATGNSSERPLVVAAAKVGLRSDELTKKYHRVKENPFNSKRKMMSVLVEPDLACQKEFGPHASFVSIVKGAPNIIAENCVSIVNGPDGSSTRPLNQQDRALIAETIDLFSSQAFRVLAVAYKPFPAKPDDVSPENLESGLVLAGLIASIDPERKEVGPSIQRAAHAGIRTVMITGDYVKTAKAIAENIGLLPQGSPDDKAIDCEIVRNLGAELQNAEEQLKEASGGDRLQARVTVEQLQRKIDSITAYVDVFARAKPSDKITIVRSLQRQGNVCSMTGDGVNDAPALKQANIGVAMGITGTDVAKAASDMVLTDDNFVSIVSAIEEGRLIYSNITKFVFYLLSTNVSEVALILIAVIMGLQSPLLPIQILWLNLTTDGAPAVALAMEEAEPGIMDEGPRPLSEPIVEKVQMTGIVIHNIIMTTVCLGTYILGLYWETDSWDGKNPLLTRDQRDHGTKSARTMTTLVIVGAELLRAYTSRSLRQSIFTLGVFSNPKMQWGVGISVVATIIIAVVPGVQDIFQLGPITGREWGWVAGVIWIPAIGDEVLKFIYRKIDYGRRPLAVHPGRAAQSPNKPVGDAWVRVVDNPSG